MRTALTALLGAIAVSGFQPALAAQAPDPYAWCAEYLGFGGPNCYFTSLEQCRAALSGNGGFCRENLFYTGRADAQVKSRHR